MRVNGLAQPARKFLCSLECARQPSEPQAIRWTCRQINPGLTGLRLAKRLSGYVVGRRDPGGTQVGA